MLKAIKNWVGVDGHVTRGDIFEPLTQDRADQLIESGRAIEVKGTDDVETSGETKEQPKKSRARKSKPRVETKDVNIDKE